MRVFADLLSIGYGGATTYVSEVIPRIASRVDLTVLLRKGWRFPEHCRLPESVRIIEAPASCSNQLFRHAYQMTRVPSLVEHTASEVLFCPGGLTGTSEL